MNNVEFLNDLAGVLEVPTDTLCNGYYLGEAWDSLIAVSAISLIDKHFGVTVAAESLVQCESVNELTDLIEKQVAG